MKSENKQKFSLTGLFMVIGALALFVSVLTPAISRAKLMAEQRMVGVQGKDIFIAIVDANTRGEPFLGSISVWPKTQIDRENRPNFIDRQDISEMTFSNSTRYFYALLGGENIGVPFIWAPYVTGINYSHLAGAGVSKMVGTGELKPENNMWSIAANIPDDMDDGIPVLVTRNVDCSSFRIKTPNNPDTPLRWSQQYTTPFGNKCFVIVRRGGAVFYGTAKLAATGAVYPVGDDFPSAGNTNLTSLVYLTPDGIAYPQ